MPSGKAWLRQVQRHFAWLSDYGYQVQSVDDSSFWEVTVVYSHRATQ